MMELTTVRARGRICTRIPVTIGLGKTKGEAVERKDAKGGKREV